MEAHSVPEEEMALVELSLVLHEIADSLIDLGVYPWPDTQEYDRADSSIRSSGCAVAWPATAAVKGTPSAPSSR